ncbi:MAG: amidohydrolase [Acidobacteria bacterium]|nr:amidohydrolase [Acidobacteriota bacterium]
MAARLTTYLVVAIVAATLIAGLIVGAQRDDNSGPVDLIVHNARVYAADDAGTTAEAVAVRGNKILHVGSNREILRYRRPQTTVIDARGAAVLPGFDDAHTSLIAGGLAHDAIDLGDATTLEDMHERLAAADTTTRWVVAHGWTYDRFADLPTRTQLDAAVSDRPAVAFSQDGHAAWLNTKALEAAGIARRTPTPPNGLIVRDARGEPTGLVKDGAIALVTRAMPPAPREARARALRLAIRDAHEHGVTSVQTFGETADDLDLYDAARRAGELTVRVYVVLPVSAPLSAADLATIDRAGKRFFDDPLLKTGAASIRIDGSIPSHTAALLNPYASRAAATGLTYLEPAELNEVVAALDARGVQVAADAAGDRAVRMALDAFESAAGRTAAPPRPRRHRVERAEIVDPDDLPRFETLGLIASLQPLYAAPERLQAWGRNLGAERAPLGWPARSLAAAGARLTFGTDWPNLPMDPLAGLNAAVARASTTESAEETATIDESLPLKSAINAWTSGAAWASFDDHRKGTIKPGMLADLVVLSTNIFDAKTRRLDSTTVEMTIFDGKVVYRRKAS